MIIGILKEAGTENRVAILPGEVAVLKKMGIDVLVELHAGERAFAADKDFQSAGAIIAERKEIISRAEMLLSVNPPLEDDIILSGKVRFYVQFLILLKTATGLKKHDSRD